MTIKKLSDYLNIRENVVKLEDCLDPKDGDAVYVGSAFPEYIGSLYAYFDNQWHRYAELTKD